MSLLATVRDVTLMDVALRFDVSACASCRSTGFPWYLLCAFHAREEEGRLMARAGRIMMRGGWSLRGEAEGPYWHPWPGGGHGPSRRVAWSLDGLLVTAAEYGALSAVRADSPYWDLRSCGSLVTARPGEAVTVASGIRLEEHEALAIRRGVHPLAVLLPRIWARPLSLEEMMSA